MTDRVLVHWEDAAKLAGFSKVKFWNRLNLPDGHPHKFAHLELIDDEYVDLRELEKVRDWAEARRGQSEVLKPGVVLEKIESLKGTYNGAKFAALLAVSHFAGLRVSEIAALRIEDIASAKGTLKTQTFLRSYETKTRQRREVELLNKNLRDPLQLYVDMRLKMGAKMSAPVFESKTGKHLSSAHLAVIFKRLYARLGLPNCSSHSGRSSLASNLISAGVEIADVQRILGHSSIKTTLMYTRSNKARISDVLRAYGNE